MSPRLSSAVPGLIHAAWRFARPRRGPWWLAVVGLLVGLVGCASPGRESSVADAPAAPGWREVRIGAIPLGATVDQVRAALGDPSGIVRESVGVERWSFPEGRAAWPEAGGAAVRVRWRDGRVTAIEVVLPQS